MSYGPKYLKLSALGPFHPIQIAIELMSLIKQVIYFTENLFPLDDHTVIITSWSLLSLVEYYASSFSTNEGYQCLSPVEYYASSFSTHEGYQCLSLVEYYDTFFRSYEGYVFHPS